MDSLQDAITLYTSPELLAKFPSQVNETIKQIEAALSQFSQTPGLTVFTRTLS